MPGFKSFMYEAILDASAYYIDLGKGVIGVDWAEM
jgi:hypothetical protein